MDKAVAVGARHLVVDLRDDVTRALRSGQSGVDAYPKTAEAMRVGRRDFDERNIDRHRSAFEKFFDFAQINGRVIGAPVIDGIAHIAADEHRIVAKVPSHFRRNVGRAAHGHHVDDFYVFDVGARCIRASTSVSGSAQPG